MFWRKLLAAGGVLVLLAGASWLPAPRGRVLPATAPSGASLARPALEPAASWPAAATNPVHAVEAFFWSLGTAVSAQHGAATTPGAATAGPFARAYAYLSPQWQSHQSFAAFLRQWSPVQHLDLLASLPAGAVTGAPLASRVFVEVRQISATASGGAPLCLCFAYGFYTAAATHHGFRLSMGGLTPEDFALTQTGRHTAERAAAEAATAFAAARGWGGQPSSTPVHLTLRPHHQATASIPIGDHVVTVHLYELASGAWVAVRTSTCLAGCTAPISPPPNTTSPS